MATAVNSVSHAESSASVDEKTLLLTGLFFGEIAGRFPV